MTDVKNSSKPRPVEEMLADKYRPLPDSAFEPYQVGVKDVDFYLYGGHTLPINFGLTTEERALLDFAIRNASASGFWPVEWRGQRSLFREALGFYHCWVAPLDIKALANASSRQAYEGIVEMLRVVRPMILPQPGEVAVQFHQWREGIKRDTEREETQND